jgi:hypothetical protein
MAAVVVLGACGLGGIAILAGDDGRIRDPTTRVVRPRARAPTRLVGEPLLFRLEGTRAPAGTDLTAQLRYVLFFRLTRGLKSAIYDGSRHGLVVLAGAGVSPHTFSKPGQHCFAASLDGKGSDDPSTARALDRLDAGSRVKAEIQPLTPAADGSLHINPGPYVRHPRIRVSRVRFRDPSYELTSPVYREQLRRLGCPKR